MTGTTRYNVAAAQMPEIPSRARELESAMQQQHDHLMDETLRLVKQEKIKPDDVTVSMLMRKLLVTMHCGSESAQNNALGHLLQIKGLKRQGGVERASKKNAMDDVMSPLIESLKSTAG